MIEYYHSDVKEVLFVPVRLNLFKVNFKFFGYTLLFMGVLPVFVSGVFSDYGKHILMSFLSLSISPGASISGVENTPSPSYLFFRGIIVRSAYRETGHISLTPPFTVR